MTALGALVLAAQALAAAGAPAASYDALLAEAVAASRAGERLRAEGLLQRARALDPARPEALVELAGLRFLDARYGEAVALLRPAVRTGAGAHAADLLATSLHLAGRADEAVEQWNTLGRPLLRNVRVSGMHDTRARLVVPQLTFAEGALLTTGQLRETRLRLAETGAFQRAIVRPVPLGSGEADVEVALVERHGLGSPLELAAVTLSKALQRTAYLRYDNVDGTGVGARVSYRWQDTQPRAEAALSWPRPLGIDATLLAQGQWERAEYDLSSGALTLRARGAELALRHVLGPGTVGDVRWRVRRRSFAGAATPLEEARKGRVSALSLYLERRLFEGERHRVDGSAGVLGAAAAFGSQAEFAVGRARLRAHLALSDPAASPRPRSALAAQLIVGAGSGRTPIDEMFVPGAASEMDLPLRAYRDRTGGVLGRTPIGRSILLANFEWRPQLFHRGPLAVGGAVFYDAARSGGLVPGGGQRFLHAAGAGLRVHLAGVVLRVDCAGALGHPFTSALTAGLGQAF